jgi:hypothetical protein
MIGQPVVIEKFKEEKLAPNVKKMAKALVDDDVDTYEEFSLALLNHYGVRVCVIKTEDEEGERFDWFQFQYDGTSALPFAQHISGTPRDGETPEATLKKGVLDAAFNIEINGGNFYKDFNDPFSREMQYE